MNFTLSSLFFFTLFRCFPFLAIYTSLMDWLSSFYTSSLHLLSLGNTDFPTLSHYSVDKDLSNAITIPNPHFRHKEDHLHPILVYNSQAEAH